MRFVRSLFESLHPRNDWHNHPRLRAARYLLRTATAPRLHRRWLAQLNTTAMREATLRDGHLFERWQHRWVSRQFGKRERLVRLIDHHGLMPRLLSADDLLRVCRGETLVAGDAAGKDGKPVQVTVAAPILRCLEGELVLGLVWRGTAVFSMTITLCPGRDEVLVGCIQGPRSHDGLGLVRDVTKACHGLRPKDLLLSAVRSVATAAGITRVRGPGNQAHVFGNTHRVKASYDGFWEEAGGTMGADGLYEVSAAEPVRDMQYVPSKHRSAFRAREALRETLCTEVSAFFAPVRHLQSVPQPMRAFGDDLPSAVVARLAA